MCNAVGKHFELHRAALCLFAETLPLPSVLHISGCLGFEKFMTCGDIMCPLQVLLAKSWEWPLKLPICVGCGDVFQAFDHLKGQTAVRSMQFRQQPAWFIHGWERENLHNEMEACFQNTRTKGPIPFNKCERTGDTGAPKRWNWAVEHKFAQVQKNWSVRNFGLRLGRWRFTHLVWADNMYLLANSIWMLREMLQELSDVMFHDNMFWKPDSLCFLTSGAVVPLNVTIYNPETKSRGNVSIPWVESTIQLGMRLHSKGSTSATVEHRKTVYLRCFWAGKLLRGHTLSLHERFRRYFEQCVPTFTYCLYGCALSKTILQNINGMEGSVLRKIAHFRKSPGDSLITYFRKSIRKARKLYILAGHTTLVERILRELHIFGSRTAAVKTSTDAAAGSFGRFWMEMALNTFPEADRQKLKQQKTTKRCISVKENGSSYGVEYARDRDWTHRKEWKYIFQWEQLFIDQYGWEWRSVAKTDKWELTRDDFIYETLERAGLGGKAMRKLRQKGVQQRENAKAQRRKRDLVQDISFVWRSPWPKNPRHIRALLDIRGDNLTTVEWANGRFFVKNPKYIPIVSRTQRNLHSLYMTGRFLPARAGENWARHIFRELNTVADGLCNMAIHAKKGCFTNNAQDYPDLE